MRVLNEKVEMVQFDGSELADLLTEAGKTIRDQYDHWLCQAIHVESSFEGDMLWHVTLFMSDLDFIDPESMARMISMHKHPTALGRGLRSVPGGIA